jgi:hypothetical protein
MALYIQGAVEGPTDRALLVRLLKHVGHEPGAIYIANGKAPLVEKLRGYNAAARYGPWAVLVDLDRDHDCAPAARRNWLPVVAANMSLRIPVRAAEAWLLADRARAAVLLGVPTSRIPADPDGLDDPKQTLVDLARTSRRRVIRDDLVPTPGSGRRVGAGYVSRIVEFVIDEECWRPEVAAGQSDSLRRALEALRVLGSTSPRTDGRQR